MVDTIHLTNGWFLHDDFEDVLITGPGNLEIVMFSFDVHKLVHTEGLGPEAIGTLRQLSWRYPLTSSANDPDSEWQMISTWDSAAPEVPAQYRMLIGAAVTWQLPEEVGQRLEGWLVRKEEPAL